MLRGLRELFLAHRHSREPWNPRDVLLGRDRRLFQRVSVQIPCRVDNRFFGSEGEGTAVDMSLGGLGVLAPVIWPEGSQVRVSMESLSLAMNGLIVFRKELQDGPTPRYRYGVKFQQMSFHDLFCLRKVLQAKYKGPLAIF